ncbi:MAG: hypothetical protein Q4P29_07210 [Tissierellia bacterium]|nr:hypothetical protein [Tissierellia bacterium]
MQKDIIISEEYKNLKAEVAKLKAELAALVLEHDELKYVVCKNIETKYLLELGTFIFKVYEAECEYLRLKRKSELIQANINREEAIDLKRIENILDEELIEYKKKMDAHIAKMNKALERGEKEFMTDDEEKEFKALYYKIVKALHPDLNPKLSANKKILFERAVSAYKNGDIKALKIIEQLIEKNENLKEEDSINILKNTKENLLKALRDVKSSIKNIKESYPYNLREFTDNPTNMEKRKNQLIDTLLQYKTMTKKLNKRIEELLR